MARWTKDDEEEKKPKWSYSSSEERINFQKEAGIFKEKTEEVIKTPSQEAAEEVQVEDETRKKKRELATARAEEESNRGFLTKAKMFVKGEKQTDEYRGYTKQINEVEQEKAIAEGENEKAEIIGKKPEEITMDNDLYVQMYLGTEKQVADLNQVKENIATYKKEADDIYNMGYWAFDKQLELSKSGDRNPKATIEAHNAEVKAIEKAEGKSIGSIQEEKTEELMKRYLGSSKVEGSEWMDEVLDKQRGTEDIKTDIEGFKFFLDDDLKDIDKTIQNMRQFQGEVEINKGFIEGIKRGINKKALPVFGTGMAIADAYNIYDIAKKKEAGEELSEKERISLAKYYSETEIQNAIDKGRSTRIGEGVPASISLAAEVALTAGAASTAKAATSKVISKSLMKELGEEGTKELLEKGFKETLESGSKKALATKVASELGGSIASAAVTTGTSRSLSVAQSYQEFVTPEYQMLTSDEGEILVNRLNEGDNAFKAMTKSIALNLGNNWIETTGGQVVDAPLEAVQKKVLGEYMAKTGIKTVSQLDTLIKKSGIDGFAGEVFEEEMQYALEEAVNGREYEFSADRLMESAMSVMAIQGVTKGSSTVIGTSESIVDNARGSTVEQEQRAKVDNLLNTENQQDGVSDMTTDRPLDGYQDYVEQIQRGGVTEFGQAGLDKLNELKQEAIQKHGEEAASIFNLAIMAYESDLEAGETKNIEGKITKDDVTRLKEEATTKDIATEESKEPIIKASEAVSEAKTEVIQNTAEDTIETTKRETVSPKYETAEATTEDYYIKEGDSYTKIEGAKDVTISKEMETFVHQDAESGEYDVIDTKTGIAIASSKTEVGAINKARNKISTQGVPALVAQLKQVANEQLTPRYGQPEQTIPAMAKKTPPAIKAEKEIKTVKAPKISGEVFASREDAIQNSGIEIGDTIVINGQTRTVKGFSDSVSDTNGVKVELDQGTATLDIAKASSKTGVTKKAVKKKEEAKKDKERKEKRDKGEFIEDATKKDIQQARMKAGRSNPKAKEVNKSIKSFKQSAEYKQLQAEYKEQLVKPAFFARKSVDRYVEGRAETYGEEAEVYYGNIQRRIKSAQSYIQSLEDLKVYEIEKDLIARGLMDESASIMPTVDEAMAATYLQEFKREDSIYPDQVVEESLSEAVTYELADMQGELKEVSLLAEFKKYDTFKEFKEAYDADPRLLGELQDMVFNSEEYQAMYEADATDTDVLRAMYNKYKTQPGVKMRRSYDEVLGKKITKKVQEKIMAQSKKWFNDDKVLFQSEILTPSGNKALGKYFKKWIHISEQQSDPADTFAHEAVHKALDLYNKPLQKQKILNEVISKYGEAELKEKWALYRENKLLGEKEKYLFAGEKAREFKKNTQFIGKFDKKTRFEIDDSKAEIETKLTPLSVKKRESLIDSLEVQARKEIEDIKQLAKEEGYSKEYIKKAIGDIRNQLQELTNEAYDMFKRQGDAYELTDMLKHEELYQNYPELKDVTVMYVPKKEVKGYLGLFSPSTDIIKLSDELTNDQEIKSVLLHEVQHWIQHREGFDTGASLNSPKIIDAVIRKFEGEVKGLPAFEKIKEDPQQRRDFILEYARSQTETNSLEELLYQEYFSVPGEAEARDVQTRINLSMEDRARIKPYLDAIPSDIEEVFTRDAHTAPRSNEDSIEDRMEYGGDFSLTEVANGHHTQPADYFDPQVGARYYSYNDDIGAESFNAINKAFNDIKNGKRQATITAYRAIPNDVKASQLINGDWVSFSKKYAILHGESRFGENEYKIIEQKVESNNLWWDGNDINEWGFDTGETKDDYNPAKFNTGETANTIFDMAEEQLAEDFIAYVNGAEAQTSQLKQFFDELIEFIKTMVGKGSEINKLYSDLYSGRLANKAESYSNGLKPSFRAASLDDLVSQQAPIKPEAVKQGRVYEAKSAITSSKKIQIEAGKRFVSTPETRFEASMKPISGTSGKLKYSKAFTRVQERYGNELEEMGEELKREGTTYNAVNLQEDVARAVQFVQQHPKAAMRIARGLDQPPNGILDTSISLAVSELALEQGDTATSALVEASMSARKTRAGQEIVALRGRIAADSPGTFIQRVIEARRQKMGGLTVTWRDKISHKRTSKKGKPKAKYWNKVDGEVKKMKETLKNTTLQEAKLAKAQDFLDKLACKS